MNEPAAIWNELLTAVPQNASEPRRERLLRQRAAEVQFLSWLQLHHGRLYVAEHQLEIDADFHQRALREIFESSKTLTEARHKAAFYRNILIAGKKRLEWVVEDVILTMTLPRNIPLLTEKEFRDIPKLRRLAEIIHARLTDINNLSPHAQAGLILFSAIVHGGLFKTWKHESMFLAPRESWVVEPWGTWVDMYRHRETAGDAPILRWFPDPLTEILLSRFWKNHGYRRLMETGSPSIVLQHLFREMRIPKPLQPSSAAMLARWASNAAALNLPPFLREAANDRPFVTSLPAETWLRLYRGMRVYRSKPKPPLEIHASEEIHVGAQVAPVTPTSQIKFLRRIRRALNQQGRKKQIAGIRAALQEAAQDSPGPMPLLIACFVLDLMLHGSMLKDRLKTSSIKRYLSAIQGPLLKASMRNPNVMAYSAEDWEACLQEAIHLSEDQQTPNRIAAFGAYVSSLPEMPDIDLSNLEGASVEHNVNANLISPAEFEEAMDKLTSGGCIQRIQRLIGALGFYAGLRRNEALTLLLCDVAGRSDPELLVRPNHHASTKNRSSRRIPLGKLLPNPWLQEFMDWFELRLVEQQGKADHSLLFCMPGAPNEPLPPKATIDPVVHALHDVTGDRTLVFHSLRHSCANWLLLRMLIPELPDIADARIALFNHPLFSMQACKELRYSFYRSLVTPSPAPVRDILAQVGELLGHQSPEVTLKSYVHLVDWCLRLSFSANVPHITEAGLRAIADFNSQYWFEFKRKKLKHLDSSQWLGTLAERARKPHLQALANPVRQQIARRKRLAAKERKILDPVMPHVIPSVLRMLFYFGLDDGTVARLHKLDQVDVARIRENATHILETRTRYGNPRLPLIPSKPRANADIQDFQRVINVFENETLDEHLLRFGLTSFLHGDPNHSQAAIFSTPEDAKRYQQFLQMLRIPKSRMMAKFFPDARLCEANVQQALRFWSSSLGIPSHRIQIIRKRRVERSSPTDTWIGHISVTAASAGVKVLQQSVGLKSALHVLIVFMYDRYFPYSRSNNA